MYELPPVLKGSTQAQVAALRDYLVRMVRMNNSASAGQTESGEASGTAAARASGSGSKGGVSTVIKDEIQKNVDKLRSLIIKTAEAESAVVDVKIGAAEQRMAQEYVAISDYGVYESEIYARIAEEAARITQEALRTDTISTRVGNAEQELQAFKRLSHGQIEYGYFTDSQGTTHWGIAISEQLLYTNGATDTTTTAGIEYWPLQADQTMGFYTSTGWEFWVGGRKVGWFDSQQENGLLHTPSQVTENDLQVNTWLLTDPGSGFGIKYIGG